MLDILFKYAIKPELYASGTDRDSFWDDAHISQYVLDSHLNPEWDSASRNHKFINDSVQWITKIAPPNEYKNLLDLGCGPGIYAEKFASAGFNVTGVDFSQRSIAYAKKQTEQNRSNIIYHYQNYLTLEFTKCFDVITLIYCDYASLSVNDRLSLLKIVYNALKPNGKFIFDVFTPVKRKAESSTWKDYPNGGFWNEKPHICLNNIYQYDDADKTELHRTIIIMDDKIECINLWEHYFTKKMLLDELMPIGFRSCNFYGNIAGREYSDDSETICGVFTK